MAVQPCGATESSDGVDYWTRITNNDQNPANPNYKYANLYDTLEASSFELCIWVQLQEDPCLQPVEDATVQWGSTLRLAGRILINQGLAPLYNEVCENTVYNPFRTIPEHLPIGSINRIRHAVYAYAQTFRLYANHGRSLSPAEASATQLPLQQPNDENAPSIPDPYPVFCASSFDGFESAAPPAATVTISPDLSDKSISPDLSNKSTVQKFDCSADVDQKEVAWSVAKYVYCCKTQGICFMDFDCNAGYNNWQRGWSSLKQHQCCLGEGKGCPQDEPQADPSAAPSEQ